MINTKTLSVLLSSLLLLSLFSCEDKNSEKDDISLISIDNANIIEFQKKAKEYGLNDVLESVDYINYNTDTTAILFSGIKNKKFHIGCFNTDTKEALISWRYIENLDTTITLNLGYGDSISKVIEEYHIGSFEYYKDTCILLLYGQNDDNYEVITSDIYSITNDFSTKQETTTYPNSNYYYYSINQWTKSTLSIELRNERSERKNICCNYGGINLFEFYSSSTLSEKKHIIDIYKYIAYTSNTFICKNAQTGAMIWESENIIEHLPTDAKVERTLTSESETHLEFIYTYTLYDGTKGSVNLTLEKETGKIKKE